MDVNKAVKVNNIAKELLKHGLVSNFEEGVEKAQNMERDGVSITEHQEESQDAAEEEQPSDVEIKEKYDTSHTQNTVPGEANDVKILERKLNYLTKSFTEQFNAEMGTVKKQIENITKELISLKRDVKVSASAPQEQPTEQKKDDEEVKPRTGDLTPDEVELEDFFYFGNKKK